MWFLRQNDQSDIRKSNHENLSLLSKSFEITLVIEIFKHREYMYGLMLKYCRLFAQAYLTDVVHCVPENAQSNFTLQSLRYLFYNTSLKMHNPTSPSRVSPMLYSASLKMHNPTSPSRVSPMLYSASLKCAV